MNDMTKVRRYRWVVMITALSLLFVGSISTTLWLMQVEVMPVLSIGILMIVSFGYPFLWQWLEPDLQEANDGK